jgi:hypothetical protein
MHSSIPRSCWQLLARLLIGVLLVLPAAAAVPIASAQCADPRGNSYCSNNGQVTFNPPPNPSQPASQPCADPRGNAYCQGTSSPHTSQVIAPPVQPVQPAQTGATNAPGANSPAVQPNAPVTTNANLIVDPPSAAAGATIAITASGLGPNRSAWVNLSHMTTAAGLNLGAKQLATVNTAVDGSLNTTVIIPAVPSWTTGKADICLINASAQPVCAPFTLTTAEQAVINSATTPAAIVGHYQCSSATLIGFGGGWCTGGEPVLALNGDSGYAYGDEQGSWSFDGTTVSFDGSLGTASVLNRRLTIETQVDMPDGSGMQQVRYIYIRMDY